MISKDHKQVLVEAAKTENDFDRFNRKFGKFVLIAGMTKRNVPVRDREYWRNIFHGLHFARYLERVSER